MDRMRQRRYCCGLTRAHNMSKTLVFGDFPAEFSTHLGIPPSGAYGSGARRVHTTTPVAVRWPKRSMQLNRLTGTRGACGCRAKREFSTGSDVAPRTTAVAHLSRNRILPSEGRPLLVRVIQNPPQRGAAQTQVMPRSTSSLRVAQGWAGWTVLRIMERRSSQWHCHKPGAIGPPAWRLRYPSTLGW